MKHFQPDIHKNLLLKLLLSGIMLAVSIALAIDAESKRPLNHTGGVQSQKK